MCNPRHDANCAISEIGKGDRIKAEEYFFRNSDHGQNYQLLQQQKLKFDEEISRTLENTKGERVNENESRERFYNKVREEVNLVLPEHIYLIADDIDGLRQNFYEIEQGLADKEAQKDYLSVNKQKIVDAQPDFYPCFTLSPSHINRPFCQQAHERKKKDKDKEVESQISELNELIKDFEHKLENFMASGEGHERELRQESKKREEARYGENKHEDVSDQNTGKLLALHLQEESENSVTGEITVQAG